MPNKIFLADKISGIEGGIYGLSEVLDIVMTHNEQHRFRFPFYGLCVRDETQRSDEYISNEGFAKETEAILAHVMESGISYFQNQKAQIIELGKKFHSEVYAAVSRLGELNDEELLADFFRLMELYTKYYGYGCTTFLYEGILSERLDKSLRERYEDSTDIIAGLMSNDYKSFMLESEEELLEINKEKNSARRKKLIDKYKKDFFYIKSNYSYAPVLDDAKVMALAEEVSHHESRNTVKLQSKADLTKEEEAIIALLRETEAIRDQRKRINLMGSYMMFRFLEEVCGRKKIDIKLGRRIVWREMADLLKIDGGLMEKLKNREVASFVYHDGKYYFLEYEALKPRDEVKDGTTECKGTPASRGVVKARANIVWGSKDFPKFKKGDILITEMTRPEFLPVMKRAAAIVTDEGGLTCHAAIVARELGIPCVVGAKIATRILKDGDQVLVDAEKGVVRKINK